MGEEEGEGEEEKEEMFAAPPGSTEASSVPSA